MMLNGFTTALAEAAGAGVSAHIILKRKDWVEDDSITNKTFKPKHAVAFGSSLSTRAFRPDLDANSC
jgi:hypothetical protein